MSEKKSGPLWGWLLAIAVVIGGVYLYMREQEAQQCRRALAYSTPITGYSGDAGAALALASELNHQKAQDCYVRGLISTPP
jgi:hypothetical protein